MIYERETRMQPGASNSNLVSSGRSSALYSCHRRVHSHSTSPRRSARAPRRFARSLRRSARAPPALCAALPALRAPTCGHRTPCAHL